MAGRAYDLLMLLRKRSADVFDVHLTVAGLPENIEAVAARLGLKFVRIELSRGAHRNQPMLTGTVKGDLDVALASALARDWRNSARHTSFCGGRGLPPQKSIVRISTLAIL